jgi:hypothetical protein
MSFAITSAYRNLLPSIYKTCILGGKVIKRDVTLDRFLRTDKKSRSVFDSRSLTGGYNPTPERGA